MEAEDGAVLSAGGMGSWKRQDLRRNAMIGKSCEAQGATSWQTLLQYGKDDKLCVQQPPMQQYRSCQVDTKDVEAC